ARYDHSGVGRHVSEQLLGELYSLLGGFRDAFRLQLIQTGFNCMCPVGHAAVIGDLDVQACAGVELENQRNLVHIQHHVDADVTQAPQLVAAGGELHEAVPVGQLNAIHRVGSVGVLGNLVVQPGATQGHAGGQVHAHTDSALVQVGFAARLTCRQAQHGHHRIAHQHDDANIRHAFVADALEDRVRGYAVLDQCAITVPAQRVKAGEDIGDLMLQFVVGDDLAGNRAIATFETVR